MLQVPHDRVGMVEDLATSLTRRRLLTVLVLLVVLEPAGWDSDRTNGADNSLGFVDPVDGDPVLANEVHPLGLVTTHVADVEPNSFVISAQVFFVLLPSLKGLGAAVVATLVLVVGAVKVLLVVFTPATTGTLASNSTFGVRSHVKVKPILIKYHEHFWARGALE